ncbi:hypothetical protein DIPPA_09621 [Diplonema papillatum]|nr:hypothetical protein DIPPA_09621 [Diplonema papillatum]
MSLELKLASAGVGLLAIAALIHKEEKERKRELKARKRAEKKSKRPVASNGAVSAKERLA